MTIIGDLIELTDNLQSDDAQLDLEDIPWEFNEGVKIPPETCSLYSVDSEIVSIHELKNEVFDFIQNASFSHIYSHIYPYDELFILFFEFAIEKDPGKFEFAHFGIVPAGDFFTTLDVKNVLKIRDKTFQIKKDTVKKILEKVDEFKNKYPKNSLL